MHVEADGSEREALCCDVSGTGMQLAMTEALELGTPVVLSFDAPGGEGRRIVAGRVVRSEPNVGHGSVLWPHTVGVQFDAVDPLLAELGAR